MHGLSRCRDAPLITLKRVTLRSGDRILLPETSWTIRCGENWAILGPNGSGKSALAKALRGDVPHVRGALVRHRPEAEGRSIGYVSFELQEELLAREERRDEARCFSGRGREITAGELLRGGDGDPAALNAVVDRLGLRPLLGQGFRTLSNGEIRKLLIARALLPSPKLLILDDPFAGLDAENPAVELEYQVDHLGEDPRRCTSIDVVLRGKRHVYVECKLAEDGVGGCSRPRLADQDPDHCNGNYEHQMGRQVRCALTARGIGYWQYIPGLFGWNDIDQVPCPIRSA